MRCLRKAIFGLVFFSRFAFGDTSPTADELLQAADRARGSIAGGVTWTAEVESIEDGNKSNVQYLIRVKGDNALAEATAPARAKGEAILFNDRNLWFAKPGLKKPVAISPRQKLMGAAANGDIASTNYARDYDGSVVGSEKLDGADAWKMELKAKAKNVTYDKIRYWVEKKRKVGLKAEFLTVSGEVFKVAHFSYSNTIQLEGTDAPFVSQMLITDPSFPNNTTTIRYLKIQKESHPDSIFNSSTLVK